MVAFYTSDAVVIDPVVATVRGRARIEKYMKDTFAAEKIIDFSYKTNSFERSGDIAFETGTIVETVQEKGT